MALTQNQDLPVRPAPKEEGWSSRRLFPLRATASALAKTFVSPLEVLLAGVVLVLGLAVLLNRPAPVLFYILALGLLFGVLFERVGAPPKIAPTPEKEKKQKAK